MGISLSRLHEMCDLCEEPTRRPGAALTFINADKIVEVRHNAELALKFYNDIKLKNFKLVKVCKASYTACTFCGMIFRAREDGSEELSSFSSCCLSSGW
ncbi:uncharacterized protein [Henckelia pumila]|uniref:uncharacterized protein isoform X2 n=1 Tax=Henckelia pumila TaxID=405737 RepID=UPI003C6EA34F